MASFWKRLFGGGHGEPVIIVSGLPRSGTSMAMKMLEAGGFAPVQDGIRTADLDNPKGYYEDERVKDLHKMEDKSWVRNARGKVLKVISFLLKDLPEENDYKVIFMRREVAEVLASQNKMLDHRGEESETEDARMAEIYRDHLEKVDVLLRTRENFTWIDIPYSEAIRNPLEQADRINRFLGGGMDVRKMAAVVDPELYRNRA
ncbi:MAG: sulfotransferase family protein [Candidatus Eisenbacteria bacterium]|nr:sulfotransferase family protein [Candidatus Eisenbacteria bacterium]